MISSVSESTAQAVGVEVTADALVVALADGRTVSAPLVWYPRLVQASEGERGAWRLIGGGRGIHWPELDEDVSVASLLAGRGSQETQASLSRWTAARLPETAEQK